MGAVTLQIPPLVFEPGVEGQLHAHFCAGGAHFHAEAIEMEEGSHAWAINPELQNRIEAVAEFDEGRDYETVTLGGKEYFLIIHPFQA